MGVNNIFGEDPPKEFGFELGNAFGIPGSTYDNLGRLFPLRLTHEQLFRTNSDTGIATETGGFVVIPVLNAPIFRAVHTP